MIEMWYDTVQFEIRNCYSKYKLSVKGEFMIEIKKESVKRQWVLSIQYMLLVRLLKLIISSCLQLQPVFILI